MILGVQVPTVESKQKGRSQRWLAMVPVGECIGGQGVLGMPLRSVDSLILLDSLFGHPST
jgi:hypothetical protein